MSSSSPAPSSWKRSKGQKLLGAFCSPEDTVAPEEDMDMDLDADRQALLSLPVKYTLDDAELFLLICVYKLVMKPNQEKMRWKLTFSFGMFFGIHLLVILLAFQMFLSTEGSCSEKSGGLPAERTCTVTLTISSSRVSSFSFFWSSKSFSCLL